MSALASTAPTLPDRMLSVREVAEVLGVHENSVWGLVREQRLPSYKIKGCRRFLQSEVLGFIQNCRVA